MSGDIEPYVFAKFERLYFHADFDFENAEIQPPVRIDDNHRFVAEHENRFGANLRRSGVIRNFVSLLSSSPFINRLVVHVEFSLTPEFEFRLEPLTVEENASECQEYIKSGTPLIVEHGKSFLITTCSHHWEHCTTSNPSNWAQSSQHLSLSNTM